MTVWIYIDTRYRVGHPDHILSEAAREKVFRVVSLFGLCRDTPHTWQDRFCGPAALAVLPSAIPYHHRQGK